MFYFLSYFLFNFNLSPPESIDWLEKNMIPFYPLGEIKNTLSTAAAPAGAGN